MKKGKQKIEVAIDPQIIEKSREFALSQEASKRAAADPLPGALSEAFLTDAIDCGHGLKVRRLVASDWIILKWLNSPLYRGVLESQKPVEIREDIGYEDFEGYEMVWQFTHTPAVNRALMAKGREVYKTTAFEDIGDTHSLETLSNAIEAIGKQVAASLETKVAFNESDSPKKK